MNTKTTRVFSFAGIGFSILSILLCFVGTFIVDTGTHSENVGLIEVFSLASAAREPDADFIALPMALVFCSTVVFDCNITEMLPAESD